MDASHITVGRWPILFLVLFCFLSHSLLDLNLPVPITNTNKSSLFGIVVQLIVSAFKIPIQRHTEKVRVEDRHCFTALLTPPAQQKQGSIDKLSLGPGRSVCLTYFPQVSSTKKEGWNSRAPHIHLIPTSISSCFSHSQPINPPPSKNHFYSGRAQQECSLSNAMVKYEWVWSSHGWVIVSCSPLDADCGWVSPESKFCADSVAHESYGWDRKLRSHV